MPVKKVLEAIQRRPSIHIGSTSAEVYHLVYEVVDKYR